MGDSFHNGYDEGSHGEGADSDEDFDGSGTRVRTKYPIHDSIAEDISVLKNLILPPVHEDVQDDDNDDEDSDSDEGDEGKEEEHEASGSEEEEEDEGNYVRESPDEDDSAVTDVENDNAAAAAAVYGHPPISFSPTRGIGSSQIEEFQASSFTQASALWDAIDGQGVPPNDENSAAYLTITANVTVLQQKDKDTDHLPSADEIDVENQVILPIEMNEEEVGTNYQKKNTHSPIYNCPYNIDERDGDENTPLHIAIHSSKLDHMRLLLRAGASLQKRCDGSLPIHTAISIGAIPTKTSFALEAVKLLHEYDADLCASDDANHTPLYLAVSLNLSQVVNYILNDPAGVTTLNVRSDRVGGRPLHAAAKYDQMNYPFGTLTPARDDNGTHGSPKQQSDTGIGEKIGVTQILTHTPDIDIDPTDNYGKTPLHVACGRGNWGVVRLLIEAGANPHAIDKRGFTPAGLAYKRGMTIPSDLTTFLGMPGSGIPRSLDTSANSSLKRDLIMDPDGRTLLICHELCSRHFTCPPICRDGTDVPPENIRRLSVLLDEDTGILRSAEFERLTWETEARRAAMVDVLKCHDYSYIEKISQFCCEIPDHPHAIIPLDPDTTISRWTFESALRAAGSVCEAVDRIMAGDFRNAFCAVRPPGHHAGPTGVVKCPNDPEGSHGFCILNNVAIGAAYARSMYRNDGIKKIAIIDFDVHHGNGTEAIIRSLIPTVDRATIKTSFVTGVLEKASYRPWLDETDIHNVFFASVHGYGPRDASFSDHPQMGGWFYPASGNSSVSDAIASPSDVEGPGLSEFLLSQTWTRMGEKSRENCCQVINVGLSLPKENENPALQRIEMRDSYRKDIIPYLLEFNPDIIFISAGFDAHKKDSMNFGYVGMVEDDYEWLTEQLVKVANTCCNGRVISVLEGGYKIHGGIVSPFARSVASHVRALVDGGSSRALYDLQEAEWESRFELEMVVERERKRRQRMEKLFRAQMTSPSERRVRSRELSMTAMRPSHPSDSPPHTTTATTTTTTTITTTTTTTNSECMEMDPMNHHSNAMDEIIVSPDMDIITDTNTADIGTGRKRKRAHVNYKELMEKMKKEGELLS